MAPPENSVLLAGIQKINLYLYKYMCTACINRDRKKRKSRTELLV